MPLQYNQVHRLFYYNSETGDLIWKINKGSRAVKGTVANHKDKDGYNSVRINGVPYYNSKVIWLWYHGYYPENIIDHKDRVRHHDWIDNLRESSKQCNARNTGNRSDNKSSIKGVSWYKGRNKWRATVGLNGKQISLGNTVSFIEAVCLRLAAEQCLDWPNCDGNSPAHLYMKEILNEM